MALKEKKFFNKLCQYFENKGIPYNYDLENSKLNFELYFGKNRFIIYPYISFIDGLCSININISENNIKGYNYDLLNRFNQESLFFKGYLLNSGIVCLEYRFILNEIDNLVFDKLLDSLSNLEELINTL